MSIVRNRAFVSILCLMYCFLMPLSSQQAVQKLDSDINTLSGTVSQMLSTCQNLHEKLQYADKLLSIPSKISSDLKKLQQALSTVKGLLTAASLVPELKTAAKTMTDGINAINAPIADAVKSLDELSKALKPIQDGVEKTDAADQKLIKGLTEFKSGLNRYKTAVDNAQKCISSLPDGDNKKAMQSDLDTLANASDKRVAQINTAIANAKNAYESLKEIIASELDPALELMKPIEQAIEQLDGKLVHLMDPLRELGKLMDKYFSVSFPYPDPTWSKPWRISHYELRISMKKIVNGAGAIEKEIEHLLSSALYKAAKIFGLSKLIHELINDASKELNVIKGKLHLDFKIEIPGLDKIKDAVHKAEAAADKLKSKLSVDVSEIDNLINQIKADISAMENIYNNCKKI